MRKNLTLGVAICVALLTLPAAAQVLVIPAGPDPWETTDDGTTYFELTSVQLDELCNFSGPPHSEDTIVSVAVKGVPIDAASLGTTNTVVSRLADAVFFSYGETVTVPIEVTALEFESLNPVRTNCGFLDLSVFPSGAQPVSTASITLDNPDGGTFTASVQVDLVVQASGAQNGVTQLVGTLEDSGAEPWSVHPPPNAVNPGVFNPGVINGIRVIICRLEILLLGLPAWHCYTPPIWWPPIFEEPVDPVEPVGTDNG